MSAPVAITGRGGIGAPGAGLAAQWAALQEGRDGLRRVAGGPPLGHCPVSLPGLGSRTAALGLLAARAALDEAGLDPQRHPDLPLVVATTTAGMPESETVYLDGSTERIDRRYLRHPTGATAGILARALGLHGYTSVHSEACASASCALIDGCEQVRSGQPRVLVVAMDALTRLTLAGFGSLQVVDPAGCRPFTQERAGMSLGEGAAAFVLEDPAAAQNRRQPERGRLLGWGCCSDGHHGTAPHPEGVHLRRAVVTALAEAACPVADLDLIAAHGTGTRDNDAAEATVFAGLVADRCPVVSWKRLWGHCMGAAAGMEVLGALLALQHGCVPPSTGSGLGTPLPGLLLPAEARPRRIRRVLKTTLAFGGLNTALVLGADV